MPRSRLGRSLLHPLRMATVPRNGEKPVRCARRGGTRRLAVPVAGLLVLVMAGASVPDGVSAIGPAQPRVPLTYELVETWSEVPRQPKAGQFVAPRDISSLPDETVLVLGQAYALRDPDGTTTMDVVHLVGPDGSPRALLPMGAHFQRVARTDGGFDGTIHVLGLPVAGAGGAWAVLQFMPDGSLVRRFDLEPSGLPIDVAASPGGKLYVTIAANPSRIDVFAPDGQLTDRIIPDQMEIGGPDDPYRYALSRLDVGPDGTIYVMAVAQRNCPPDGPPPRPTRPPTATPTPRPSLWGRGEGTGAPSVGAGSGGGRVAQTGLPCVKNIVLIFEPDHAFREEVPNAHTTDIAAGVSGVFVSTYLPGFRRPAQRVHELFTQDPVFTYRMPDWLEVPLPYSAPEMQLAVAPDGRVHAATNLGAPFYRGALTFGDPSTGRGPVSGPQAALGIYERPMLAGPNHPRRIDAAGEVLLLEGAYQRYGEDRQAYTSFDEDHDAQAIQRWSLAGIPLWQATQHVRLLRDGAEGSDRYTVVAPLVDVAYDGHDVFAISDQIVWQRSDALPPPWYYHLPGAQFIAASADEGRVAVLNAAGRRVLVLDRSGRLLYDKPISWDVSQRLASDVALVGDRVLLADQGRSTIMVRGIDGTDLGEWPTHDGPRRISVAPNGDVFVLGRGGYGLRYSPDGDLIATWRVPGWHGDVPVDGHDIAVGDDGRVYVNFLGLSIPDSDDNLPGQNRGYDIDAAGVWVFEPVVVDQPNLPPPGQRACIAQSEKEAAPRLLLLGEELDVTLRADGYCPGRHEPQQLIVVLDTSYSMHDLFYPGSSGPGALRRAKQILSALLGSIDPQAIEMGLVTFSGGAGMEVPLPGDLGMVRARIVTRRADGDTQMGRGVKLAHSELRGPRGNPGVKQTILIVSDGLFKDNPKPAIDAALADGIEVAALVLSTPGFDDAARANLEEVIGYPERIFIDPVPEAISDVIDHVTSYVPNLGLFETITIEDIVPANMRYIAGSAQPAADFDAATRALRWTLGPVAAEDGVRLTYRLRPLVPGEWPTNDAAGALYRDALGNEGELQFPVPSVLVLAPQTLPTVTPTPTLTPTVTPSVTPRPIYRVYLPFTERRPFCARKVVHIDVVLALDMSTSMYRRTSLGRTKHEAAIAAARLFVDQLQLVTDDTGPFDQVGIAGFNDRAWTATGLTRDRAQVDMALGGLLGEIREGTRLDLVFDEAQRELSSPRRRPENQPVLILLTDGLPNRVPLPDPPGRQEDTVLSAAKRAKDAGTEVYTIGLGQPGDIWDWLLQSAASEPSMYYYAPDGEDLARIYRRILVRLVCD